MIYVRKGQQNAAYDGKLSNLRAVFSESIPLNDPKAKTDELYSAYIDNPEKLVKEVLGAQSMVSEEGLTAASYPLV
jgi:hypothetical protein